MLGCTLLRREGRTIELTPEGKLLLDIVQPHVEAIDSLKRLFDEGRAHLSPHLVIASSQYLLRFHLPEPIQDFATSFPNVQLNIQLPTSQQLVSVVEEHVADIAICAYEPDEPRSDVLHYEPLLELPLKLLTSKKHPLARKKHVSLVDLLDYPVILPAVGSVMRRLLDRLLNRHSLSGQLQVIMETPMFDSTQQYVEMGLGVGLIYIHVPPQTLPEIHMRPIEESQVPLSIAMVVRKHGNLPQPLLDFQKIIRHHLSPK